MEKQLNYSGRFDITDIEKKAKQAIAAFMKVQEAANGGAGNLSSQKSMTDAIKEATKANTAFSSALEDERLKSLQLKNLKDELRATALKDNAQIKKNTLAQQEYNIAKKQQADIEKEVARQASIRPPTQFSDSQAEVDAANAASIGNGATGAVREQPDLSGLKEQLALVQEAKAEITAMNEAGTISTNAYADAVSKLTASEAELITVIDQYGTTQDVAVKSSQAAVVAIEEELGAIEGLKKELVSLNAQKLLANESNLPALNKDIQDTEVAISQLNNVGKEGFDEMGNKIKGASSAAGGFIGSLKSIAIFSGIAFAIGAVTEFISSLFTVAKAAAGIDRAFANLGTPDKLAQLRAQTEGLISDLDLERLSVKVDKLNIPMDKLGSFLAFAAQQAQDTGQSVDSLTDKIVDGIGRKSTRPFEQLGISTQELQAEIKKTGDFTVALSNIIAQKMAEGGTHVDTLTDKIAKQGIEWDNIKKKVAGIFTGFFDNTSPDANVIQKQTASALSAYKDFAKESDDVRTQQIADAAATVKKLSDVYNKQKNIAVPFSTSTSSSGREADQAALTKAAGEQLVVAQNVLKNLQNQNATLLNNKRVTNDIVSLDEKRQQVTNLKTMAGELPVGPDDTTSANAVKRAQYLKDAQDIQDEIDAIDGKAQKKADASAAEALKRQQAQDAASLKSKKELLEQISEVEDAYNRKSLSKNDEEVQAVNDRFKDLANKVKAFNSDPKNKNNQIDGSSLDGARQSAVNTVIAKQQVDLTKQSIDEQKQLYKEYFDYQLKYGTDAAQQAFGDQLKGYTNQVSFIQGQIKSLQGKKDPGSVALLDLYTKELPAAQLDQQKQYFSLTTQNLSRILDATQTSLSERKKIEDQYQKDVYQLSLNYYGKDAEARLRILKQNRDTALDQAKTLAFEQSAIAIEAAKNLFNDTEVQLQAHIDALKTKLKANDALPDDSDQKLTPAQRAQIQAQIDAAKALYASASPTEKAMMGISQYAGIAAQGFNGLSSAIQDVNPGLADTLSALGQIASIAGQVSSLIGSISSGNTAGIISGTVGLLVSVVTYAFRGKASAIESAKELAAFQDAILSKQTAYNIALREQARTQQDINNLTLQELETRQKMLETQKSQSQSDYDKLLAQESNKDFSYVTGEHTQKYGGIFGIGQKTKVVQDTASIAGMSFDQLNELDIEGKLVGPTKDWFEQLKASSSDIDDINQQLADTNTAIDQAFTGTTASSIADSILEGFKAGKRTMADFAGDFKSLMQQAMLSTFETGYLQDKINQFYKDFAAASEDADGLTQADEDALKAEYANIIAGGQAQIANIEKLTGSITDSTTQAQTGISGSTISKTLTEDTADELAGIFRGTYDLTKQMNNTMGDIYHSGIARLTELTAIRVNTGRTADNTDVLINVDKNIQKIADNSGKGTDINQTLRNNGIK